MTTEELLRLQLGSLKSVLLEFDKIYGLDDAHADLVEFCSDNSSEFVYIHKVEMLFCLNCDSDQLLNSSEVFSAVLSDLSLSDLKVSLLSGSLFSVRFIAMSGFPDLVLEKYLMSKFDVIEKCLSVEDVSLGKIYILSKELVV